MKGNIFLQHYFIWSLTCYMSHNSCIVARTNRQPKAAAGHQSTSNQASFVLVLAFLPGFCNPTTGHTTPFTFC